MAIKKKPSVLLCAALVAASLLPPPPFAGEAAASIPIPRESQQQSAPPPAPDAAAKPAGELLVTGFTLTGSDPWKKKVVGDLEILVTGSGARYLPLFKLLREFDLERSVEGDLVRFLPEGMPLATLDLKGRTLEVDRVKAPADLVQARSETTGENEIYLPAQTVAVLFGIELTWSEASFEYQARTPRRLKIWKTVSRSAHEIQVQDIPQNLPEARPRANPNPFGLDFLELAMRANFAMDDLKQREGRLDNLQQTLWGSFLGGAYRLNFNERDVLFNSRGGQPAGTAPVMLGRGEWLKRHQSAEISLGDSSFGLSDLAFPGVRVTGVRVNGLLGFSEEESSRDRSGRGIRSYFVQPQVFAGIAPRGSQVELRINGRVVDTQEAVPAADSEVGSGNYQFDEVILTPGSLNEVLVTVTDPNGIKSYRKQEILGSSLFLPKGRLAYLASAGTGRDVRTWHNRGLFAGGRLLYALTDRLTAGITLGAQERFYDQGIYQGLSFQQRRYPDKSLNLGAQLAWQPGNFLVLGGEAALSRGSSVDPSGRYGDTAFKLNLGLFPSTAASLSGEFFRYGAGFFDGQSSDLRDRLGYLARGKWRLSRDWSLSGLWGRIANNVDGREPKGLELGFENLEITSSAIPHSTVSLSVNRSEPSWEEGATLYIMKLYALVTPDLAVNGTVATGDSLSLSEHSDFTNGISIPGLAVEEPSEVANLAWRAHPDHELGATWARSGAAEKLFGSHRSRFLGNALRVRTDLGYDFAGKSSIVKNRTEYLLDQFGATSLELTTDYQNRYLSLLLSFNYRGLFDFRNALPAPVLSRYIQPDNGGVTGRVFVDYNADAERGPDEPGLEGVKVVMNGRSCLTDRNGYFKLPNAGEITESKVYLDLNTVPAIYSPTHALQRARIVPGIQTEVNLGVTPLISLTGTILAEVEGRPKPLYGVRVFLTRPGEAKVVAESSTAGDGSYYLGDLRPGRYLLQVDASFLQKDIEAQETAREIEIAAGREPQELGQPPFRYRLRKAPEPAATP